MITKVMVPLDGSELAERALAPAGALAQATGADLCLVRVVPRAAHLPARLLSPLAAGATAAWPTPALETRSADAPLDLATRQEVAAIYLEEMRERLTLTLGRHVAADLLLGDVAESLLDYERSAGVDLVVMCSHGRVGLPRCVLGSVADHLLRHGTAALLMLTPTGDPVCLAQVIVPLDGSVRAEATVDMVRRLGPHLAREVTLLHVLGDPEQRCYAEQYLDEVVGQLDRDAAAVITRRIVDGDPARAIVRAASPDRLIIMATHGRSGMSRWLLDSVADRVAHGGAAGVLLVRTGPVFRSLHAQAPGPLG